MVAIHHGAIENTWFPRGGNRHSRGRALSGLLPLDAPELNNYVHLSYLYIAGHTREDSCIFIVICISHQMFMLIYVYLCICMQISKELLLDLCRRTDVYI